MRIQPNYNYQNYSQPIFKASFSKDNETRHELERALRTHNGPDYVYSLIENLKNIKSDDVLSIQSDWDFYGNAVIIRNKRTNASAKFYRQVDKSNFVNYYNRRGYKISGSGAEVLYNTIMNKKSLEHLFGRNVIAQSDNFVKQSKVMDGKVLGTEDLEADISRLEKEISAAKSQIQDLNNKIQTYNKELQDDKERLNNVKAIYVRSQINVMS